MADTPSKVSRSYPHEWRFVYAPDGVSYEVRYFDEQGRPSPANGTVGRHVFTFDRLAGLESVKSLDADGTPVQPTTGCSELRRTYDTAHRLASIECRGTDGEFAASNIILEAIRWAPHAARVVIERDGTGVTNAYFDVNGELLTRVACGAARCFR